jgi:nucleoside-diphosphate-sugar epimerase
MGYNGNILYNLNYPDGQPRRCLDITKASTILNFTAKTNLDDGLKQTVDWYYKNKDMEKFVDYFNYIQ